MGTIFMNSEKRKISEPHALILKFTDKLDLRRGENIIALSNLSIYYTLKNIKSLYNRINLKYQNQHGMINLNCLICSILYQIFNFFLNTIKKSMKKISAQIYVNKIENKITIKIADEYRLELVTPEIMKLLGSTNNKITKDKNGENVPHLEITEVVLVHRNIVSNDY